MGILMRILCCLFALLLADLAAAGDKPNIVLIISDDQAWTDYGFMGHEVIQTPNLDKLAERSLLFERGYVASPLCRPSLASIVTGRYPHEHGVTGNDVDGNKNRAALSAEVTAEFHKHPSLVKTLVDNGYLAHQSGKWWEGSYADGGFTHGMTHGDPERGGRHGDAGLSIGRKGLKPVADFMDHAIREDKPFFVWYAPFLPHTPHNPPRRLLDKYTQDGRSADVAKYYAMCEWFDETCGGLIKLVDDRGLREDTVILYICDNGWAAPSTAADHPAQHLWKAYAQRSKSSPYENGIRTPVMVSWPGRIEPSKSEDFVHAIDLFPTVCALAGIVPPENLPGINLMDRKAAASRKTIYGVTHATHNMTPGDSDGTLQYLWCIEGDWKLLLRYAGADTTRYHVLHKWDTPAARLYNLADDPHEQDDLSAKHTDVLERLRAKIEAWHTVADAVRYSPPGD